MIMTCKNEIATFSLLKELFSLKLFSFLNFKTSSTKPIVFFSQSLSSCPIHVLFEFHPDDGAGSVTVEGRNGGAPLRRLLLVTYVPCGFWARLCTRLLADQALAKAPYALYRTTPSEVSFGEIGLEMAELRGKSICLERSRI